MHNVTCSANAVILGLQRNAVHVTDTRLTSQLTSLAQSDCYFRAGALLLLYWLTVSWLVNLLLVT